MRYKKLIYILLTYLRITGYVYWVLNCMALCSLYFYFSFSHSIFLFQTFQFLSVYVLD